MADLTLDQILTLLADNTTGDISAADARAVAQALFERTDGTNQINGLLFDVTPTTPGEHTPGRVHWNATDGVIEIMTGTSGVVLQVGQELYVDVRNTSGATILNGRPVRVSGASGNRPLVAPDNGQGRVIGVMTHDIDNNGNGKLTAYGLVRDVNTSAFSDGAEVYASSTGALTVSPTSSFVGYVLLAHVTNGVLFVQPEFRTNSIGTTADRPITVAPGYMYYDTTLGIPIWWNGASWRNVAGSVV